MLIERFTLNEIGTNTYVVGEPGGQVMIIDPSAPDMTPVSSFIRDQGLTVTRIVNTHCHFDHVLGNETVRDMYRTPLLIHRLELPLLLAAPDQVEHFFGYRVQPTREPDGYLAEGDVISVGEFHFRVIETPGHSPGGVCLYEPDQGVLISGDTLFAGTVGRTDLPGSNSGQLMQSLEKKLWPLPDETRIFPGHADDSTIAQERMHNPFFHF